MAASRRNQLTVADYAVVALCPSLIVLLLASLVYFVVLCVYHGQYSSRLGYIWFMFILGAVGIARISIEQSRGYATGYAAVLGLATFVVLSRFQTFSGSAAALTPLVNLLLIATVWFLADRITFDCTLIDDDKDASGQGLLDGLSSRDDGATGEAATAAAAGSRNQRRRGRQPGRTVLWLTAAALPLFGTGQFVLRSDPQLQRSAMFALAIYLFATLSLLVATSFLGVRRYLRQREVDMPANVSAAWLGGGVLMTALILALCFALPQPGRMLASFELPAALQSADWLSPSRYGWGSEGADPGEHESASGATQGRIEQSQQGGEQQGSGQQGGEQQGSGQQGSEQSGGEQSGGEQSGSEQSGGEQQQGGKPSSGEQTSGTDSQQSGSDPQSGQSSDANPSQSGGNSQSREQSTESSPSQQDQQNGQQQRSDEPGDSTEQQADGSADAAEQQADSPPAESSTAQSPPASSPLSQLLPSLSGIFKALIYLILLAILAAFLWMHRAAIADFWRQLMAWLSGAGPAPTAASAQSQLEPVLTPPRPFASFSNPLQSGADPRRAVVETFQAAEAWYREQGQSRRMDETPHEYALRLRGIEAEDRQALLRLTDAYNRIVYGGGGASQRDLQSVQSVWQSFRAKAIGG